MNFYGLTLDEQQKEFVAAILNLDKTIVFCNAVAGTGKTTIAIGAANLLVKDNRNAIDGIVYIVSPYGEQKQGYLPGSVTEKSEVYFEPAHQAMIACNMNPYADVCSESMTSKKKGTGYVKLLTHTFLRGVNLENKVVILDEAQNFTVDELKKSLLESTTVVRLSWSATRGRWISAGVPVLLGTFSTFPRLNAAKCVR